MDNIKGEFVKNKSDKGGGENSFPLVGNSGTTYAGGDNPKDSKTGDWEYSQPPQNLADNAGFVHDQDFDGLGLSGQAGVMDSRSSEANMKLVKSSINVVNMYFNKEMDPHTGAPVSKATAEAAANMALTFALIEKYKNAPK